MSLVMTFHIQHERHGPKEIIDKLVFIKIKNLLLFIEHSQEKEKASTDWEKIFTKCIANKGLLPKI